MPIFIVTLFLDCIILFENSFWWLLKEWAEWLFRYIKLKYISFRQKKSYPKKESIDFLSKNLVKYLCASSNKNLYIQTFQGIADYFFILKIPPPPFLSKFIYIKKFIGRNYFLFLWCRRFKKTTESVYMLWLTSGILHRPEIWLFSLPICTEKQYDIWFFRSLMQNSFLNYEFYNNKKCIKKHNFFCLLPDISKTIRHGKYFICFFDQNWLHFFCIGERTQCSLAVRLLYNLDISICTSLI